MCSMHMCVRVCASSWVSYDRVCLVLCVCVEASAMCGCSNTIVRHKLLQHVDPIFSSVSKRHQARQTHTTQRCLKERRSACRQSPVTRFSPFERSTGE